MRRHLNHPARRARRPRPSLLSGVETLRRLEVARLLRRLRAQAAPEHLWRLWSASATTLPSLWGLGSAHSQGTLPHLLPPGLGTATTPPTVPRPRKAVPVPGFRGRLPPSQAVGQEGDPKIKEKKKKKKKGKNALS
ncbi:hypothetical protein D6D13_08560 [Aureobasidium pullulans]|uniref:Uncharacterized protein n=1 Tax=Aureobasidium pullulans TaxID=5580 RepID=A0A4S9C5R4_AURPU|nr:hypothetical protein D6D13_08560 [Aureobasidium pullulans]